MPREIREIEYPDGTHLSFSSDGDGTFRALARDDSTNKLVANAKIGPLVEANNSGCSNSQFDTGSAIAVAATAAAAGLIIAGASALKARHSRRKLEAKEAASKRRQRDSIYEYEIYEETPAPSFAEYPAIHALSQQVDWLYSHPEYYPTARDKALRLISCLFTAETIARKLQRDHLHGIEYSPASLASFIRAVQMLCTPGVAQAINSAIQSRNLDLDSETESELMRIYGFGYDAHGGYHPLTPQEMQNALTTTTQAGYSYPARTLDSPQGARGLIES